MPKKKKTDEKPRKLSERQSQAYINGAGTVVGEPITVTLEKTICPTL